MKQSKIITLVLLGTVIAVSGCDEDSIPDGTAIYESANQCSTVGAIGCDDAYKHALSKHLTSSPQYDTQEICLLKHDDCMQLSPNTSTSIWLPAMVGFVIGNSISNSRPVYIQNPRDGQDRQVVAGGFNGPIYLGSYYGGYHPNSVYTGGVPFKSGTLNSGMTASASKAGISVPVAMGGRVGSVSAAARGGFGGSGVSSAGA